MRAKSLTHLLWTLLMVVAVPMVFAQPSPRAKDGPAGDPGQKAAENPAPKYDVSKEVKIKGTIDDVKEIPMAKGEVGVHLMVKTDKEVIEVRLCPAGYLSEINMAKGQQIEVTGSRVKVVDNDVILARELVQGNNTVTLRDKQGGPVWTWLKK